MGRGLGRRGRWRRARTGDRVPPRPQPLLKAGWGDKPGCAFLELVISRLPAPQQMKELALCAGNFHPQRDGKRHRFPKGRCRGEKPRGRYVAAGGCELHTLFEVRSSYVTFPSSSEARETVAGRFYELQWSTVFWRPSTGHLALLCLGFLICQKGCMVTLVCY